MVQQAQSYCHGPAWAVRSGIAVTLAMQPFDIVAVRQATVSALVDMCGKSASTGLLFMSRCLIELWSRLMNQPHRECGRGVLYTGPVDCLKQMLQAEGLPAP